MAKAKKVDVKRNAKLALSAQIREALEAAGLVVADGEDYGFSVATLVAETAATDIQIKFIVPKAKITKYEVLEDEVEEVEDEEVV